MVKIYIGKCWRYLPTSQSRFSYHQICRDPITEMIWWEFFLQFWQGSKINTFLMVKLWLDWLIFGDDPVWRHNQLMTSTRNARKIWPKNGGAERMLFWVKNHPARVRDCVAATLADFWALSEHSCRQGKMWAPDPLCNLFPFCPFLSFFAGSHLPIQWPNHPLLTPNSPSPGVLAPKNSNSEKASRQKESNQIWDFVHARLNPHPCFWG